MRLRVGLNFFDQKCTVELLGLLMNKILGSAMFLWDTTVP